MRDRMIRMGPVVTLIGAALLLAGCGQAALLATPTPGESKGPPTSDPTGTSTPGVPTVPPTDSAVSPPAGGAAGPTLAVVVGTSVPPSGSVLSPPLRDMTPSGPPTPGPPLTPNVGGLVIVGMDDAGRSVELRVGDTLQLALPSTYDWTVTLTDTTILMPVGAPANGQDKFKAVQAGTTTLLAGGDPACHKSQPPCEMPSRLVRIEIIVQ